MLNKFYLITSGLLLSGYVSSALLGWELFNPHRETVPANLRQSKGWYRSSSFVSYHSGYRGGK